MDGHGVIRCATPSHEGHHHETDLSIQRPSSPPQNVSHLKAMFGGPMFGGVSQRRLDTKTISVLFLISRSKRCWKVSPYEASCVWGSDKQFVRRHFSATETCSAFGWNAGVGEASWRMRAEALRQINELHSLVIAIWKLFFYELDLKLHTFYKLNR